MFKLNYKSLLILMIIATTPYLYSINTSAQESPSVQFKKYKKAGVKIPIRKYMRDEINKLEFVINRNDVSITDYIWSSLWGKDFGYYLEGADLSDKEKLCPFIGEATKLPGSKIEGIGSGKHRVVMFLPPAVIDSIIKNRCAISPKPRKSPKVSDIKKEEKTNHELFPTAY